MTHGYTNQTKDFGSAQIKIPARNATFKND